MIEVIIFVFGMVFGMGVMAAFVVASDADDADDDWSEDYIEGRHFRR